MPPKVARDPRRKSAWLKARAQHARNRELQQYSEFEVLHVTLEPRPRPQRADSAVFGPKRKQAAFVKEEELKCFREDRAGTPHISELQPDDEVIAPLTVEELGMGGEAEALATNLATDGDKMIDLHGI
ncbi:hypothetical protein EJ02DRAFT_425378 [Clathrospora elynae]|uniref:Uncharacterized protein n=1 Tax=Clathrospora elynae TaxID=706981 RepID=A0A6A5SE03_9PLEO|nr:hypothetical protein EJ02DRAFT_425378 [Clathrospora elynae]